MGKRTKLVKVASRKQDGDVWVDLLECGHTYRYTFRHVKAKTPYWTHRLCDECEALATPAPVGRPRLKLPPLAILQADVKREGVRATAKRLGICRQTLYDTIKRLQNGG